MGSVASQEVAEAEEPQAWTLKDAVQDGEKTVRMRLGSDGEVVQWLAPGRPSADSDCSTAATSDDEGEGSEALARRSCAQATLVAAQGAALGAGELALVPTAPLGGLPSGFECQIIFDWDDTLLPTSFLTDALKICPPKYGAATMRSRTGPMRGSARRGGCKLPQDFPCYAAVQRHAELVRRLLTHASSVAKVALVTSAVRPWVFESAEQYLPGLDFAALLQDLRIPVYYAGEHAKGPDTDAKLDQATVGKRNAMAVFLEQATSAGQAGGHTHVLSIGDSHMERDAAKAVLQQARLAAEGQPGAQRPLCKTVKLMGSPSLKQLSEELRFLDEQLDGLASHDGDFDLRAMQPGDLAIQAEELLGGQELLGA